MYKITYQLHSETELFFDTVAALRERKVEFKAEVVELCYVITIVKPSKPKQRQMSI